MEKVLLKLGFNDAQIKKLTAEDVTEEIIDELVGIQKVVIEQELTSSFKNDFKKNEEKKIYTKLMGVHKSQIKSALGIDVPENIDDFKGLLSFVTDNTKVNADDKLDQLKRENDRLTEMLTGIESKYQNELQESNGKIKKVKLDYIFANELSKITFDDPKKSDVYKDFLTKKALETYSFDDDMKLVSKDGGKAIKPNNTGFYDNIGQVFVDLAEEHNLVAKSRKTTSNVVLGGGDDGESDSVRRMKERLNIV
jgi:hypothetical protein